MEGKTRARKGENAYELRKSGTNDGIIQAN